MLNWIIGGVLVSKLIEEVVGVLEWPAAQLDALEATQSYRPGDNILSKVQRVSIQKGPVGAVGADIALASEFFQDLKRYVGNTYTFTLNELAQVKAMVQVVNGALMLMLSKSKAQDASGMEEAYSLGKQAAESLAVYLWQFPSARVH